MRTYKLCLLFFAVLISNTAFADDDYEKYAKEVRDSVWAWSNPEFKNYEVPGKYKDESAVIIALHEEVYATGNSKIRFTGGGFLGFNLNKELKYRHIFRKMIKLNDKSALEENAELEFKESDKSFGVHVSTLYKSVVGVRVIKPNGEIKEVDVSEAVSMTEGKKEKETNKKLAISDLEVGDILDVFFQQEGRIDFQNIPEQTFVFASRYPILSYSVHCELSKNLTNEYRLLNGAPDFTESTNEEGDYVLDVKQTDIPKVSADKWMSPLRQFPTIRLLVLYNSNKKINKPNSARDKGLYKNLPVDNILENSMDIYNLSMYYTSSKEADKLTKKYIKENPQADKKQLADYISKALSVHLNNHYDIYYNTYISTLGYLLSRYDIEYKIGFVTNRFGARGADVTAYWDYYPILVANDGSQVFTARPGMYYIGEDYRFENETAQIIVPRKYNSVKFSDTHNRSEIKLPASAADQNVNRTEMNIRFVENDFLSLDIERKTLLSGFLRNGRYSSLILRSDWIDALDRWKGEKTYLDKLKEKNKTKDIEDYEARKGKALKDQEDEVKDEIKYYHDVEVKELKSYSFPALGVTPDQPQMIYNVNYTLDGFVKRAGSNYILDIGKLIGTQLTLEDNDRNRTVDVYMQYARSYEHAIRVEIPSGYTAENVNALNKSVDNDCGTFSSSASVEGNTLIVKTKKIYKHNFEEIANWSKLVKMIDAANDFYGQSVVLKK